MCRSKRRDREVSLLVLSIDELRAADTLRSANQLRPNLIARVGLRAWSGSVARRYFFSVWLACVRHLPDWSALSHSCCRSKHEQEGNLKKGTARDGARSPT